MKSAPVNQQEAAMLNWIKNPGGKRYTATTPAGVFRLVRQNTAAGAAPWKATVERDGTTWIVAKVHYLADAKAACETRAQELTKITQQHRDEAAQYDDLLRIANQLGVPADLTREDETVAQLHERVALACEERIQPAESQDERERWQRLADHHWGLA